MGKNLPPAAVIEIIERGRTTDDTPGGSTLVPDEIRINGTPLLVSADRPITVHEISLDRPRDVVCVTLTLFARRVTIAAEGDIASQPVTGDA